MRDARITTIYEGTTGIQALDLVGRKILRDGGAGMKNLLEQMKSESGQLKNARHDGMARVMAQSMRYRLPKEMSNEVMHELIDQLFACEMPYYTASGKATIITWTINELEERFG